MKRVNVPDHIQRESINRKQTMSTPTIPGSSSSSNNYRNDDINSNTNGGIPNKNNDTSMTRPIVVREQQQPEREDTEDVEILTAATTKTTKTTLEQPQRSLTNLERKNLIFCLLAWACLTSNSTLVLGTSNLVVVSMGKSSYATLPLGAFFIGSAIVSIHLTNYLFTNYGNRTTLLIGTIIFGLLGGTILSIIAIHEQLPILYILSILFFGMCNGITYYIRFIVTELVPKHYHAKAITFTISGGLVAAFLGPETAHYTTNTFVPDVPHYLFVYALTGLFNIVNVLLISLIQFPTKTTTTIDKVQATSYENNTIHTSNHHTTIHPSADDNDNDNDNIVAGSSTNKNGFEVETIVDIESTHTSIRDDASRFGVGASERDDNNSSSNITTNNSNNNNNNIQQHQMSIIQLWQSLLSRIDFVIPMLLSTLSWTIMALPMSVVRVAMHDVDYSRSQSLRIIEFHFVGMFSTGLISGILIQKFGHIHVCIMGGFISLFSVVLDVLVPSNEDDNGNISLWLIGLFLVGVGWNFSFTASTVWLTKLYAPPSVPVPVVVAQQQQQVGSDAPATTTVSEDLLQHPNERKEEEITTVTLDGATRLPITMGLQYTKSQVQSTNDFFMFFISGMWIFCASYIYDSGGKQLHGWRTLHYLVLGFLFFHFLFIFFYYNRRIS